MQQNLKKKFSYLNRGKDEKKQALYYSIINLPYADYPDDFEDSFREIKKSRSINIELKNYLDEKAKDKELWVKAFMKKKFCCGMCTTSRIEAKHSVLKKFLNSGKRLTEVFKVIKELEEREIASYKNELDKSNKNARKKEETSDLIKHFRSIYGEYVIERLKDQLINSTNYKISELARNKW